MLVNHRHLWITYDVLGPVQEIRGTMKNNMKVEQSWMLKAAMTQEVGWGLPSWHSS